MGHKKEVKKIFQTPYGLNNLPLTSHQADFEVILTPLQNRGDQEPSG